MQPSIESLKRGGGPWVWHAQVGQKGEVANNYCSNNNYTCWWAIIVGRSLLNNS